MLRARHSTNKLGTLLTLPLSMAVLSSVYAESDIESTVDEEIIVTITKTDAAIQDIPTSVGVMTGDAIAKAGISSLADLNIIGLNSGKTGEASNNYIIRGISASQGLATTAIYIDEAPVPVSGIGSASSASPSIRLFDLERVEVLRGPAGTLYGESAIGGVIRVVTKKPSADEFEAAIELDYANIAHGGVTAETNAMLNIPLIENTLALRFTGYSLESDGFIDHVENAPSGIPAREDINDARIQEGRLALQYTTDKLTVDTSAMYYESDLGMFIPRSTEDYDIIRSTQEPLDERRSSGNVTINYDFDAFSLVSSTSYYEREYTGTLDNSNPQILSLLNAFFTGFLPPGETEYTGATSFTTLNFRSFSQELRLNSSTDNDKLDWIAGIYYSKSTTASLIPSNTVPEITTVLFNETNSRKEVEISLFGETTYHISDNLHLTTGVRWFKEEQENFIANDGSFSPVPPDTKKPDFDSIQPKISLSYDMSEDLMVYGLVSAGFRSGGTNFQAAAARAFGADADDDFDEEKLWNYETGLKGSWLANKLTLNVALFYMDWTNHQVTDQVNSAASYIFNAGDAHSTGLEIEASFRLDNLRVNTGLLLLEAELDKTANSAATQEGDRLPNTGEYQFTLSLEYDFNITEGLDAVVGGSYELMDGSFRRLPNNPTQESDSYDVVDLRFGIEADKWSSTLYVDNVFDEFTDNGVFEDDPSGGIGYRGIQPREVGLRIEVDF